MKVRTLQDLQLEKAKLILELEQKETPLLLLCLGKVTFDITQLQKKELRKLKNDFDEN